MNPSPASVSAFATHCRQHGAAAVELALLLPFFVILMSVVLFLGRYQWHYTAAQKAAQNASRYLSTISAQEMRDVALAPAAAAVAGEIVHMELDELRTGGVRPRIAVQCGGMPCQGVTGNPLPETVTVAVQMDMFDHIFGMDLSRYGVQLNARSEVRYVGN
ncbi:TadE/TadG family type IV pilus assembly protein [Telluria beijingensis]|uniref:TadE/TadG family type IV pilus assembly protein n=1 Tax=Telluria beijingensis TaxID=3068633 RepID=UPI0027957E7A|nr:TadE/TadG family type IV pilus assembly protein [Massilia sp. REN29]